MLSKNPDLSSKYLLKVNQFVHTKTFAMYFKDYSSCLDNNKYCVTLYKYSKGLKYPYQKIMSQNRVLCIGVGESGAP